MARSLHFSNDYFLLGWDENLFSGTIQQKKEIGIIQSLDILWELTNWLLRRQSLLRLTPLRCARREARTRPKSEMLLRNSTLFIMPCLQINLRQGIKKEDINFVDIFSLLVLWELTDSNRRPSACKADALNQLS